MPLNVNVADLETAKQVAVWGTNGKGGYEHCFGRCPDHQLRWKRLIDCETEHLEKILTLQHITNTDYPSIIRSILQDRRQ